MNPDDATLRADELLQDSRWIHKVARSLLTDPSAADDLVQEAWVAALAQPETRRDASGSTRSWLARVVHNLADKRWRSESRRRARETSCARRESVASTADLVARAETQRLVVEAVLALQEPYRTAILLAHIEGLSSVEIARSQGVSENTVRWRIQRGLSLLRFEMERKRGREWLTACAMLLSPADRAVVATAIKAATAGMFTAVMPNAAAALTVLALAGGATVAWRANNTVPIGNVTVAALEDPPAQPDVDEHTPSSPELAFAPLSIESKPLEPETSADTSLMGPSVHPTPTAVLVAERLRTTLDDALGAGPTTTAMSDSILKQLDEAFATAGVDSKTVEARMSNGPVGFLSLDVSTVKLPAVVVMEPRVYVGVGTVPPR